MSHRPSLFAYPDEFEAFLPENGVLKSGGNYTSWMNTAAGRLGRSIGPSDLSCETDVQALMRELLDIDQRRPGKRCIKHSKDKSNYRSTLRKYAQMVQSNYRGLFMHAPATPAPMANDSAADAIPPRVTQTSHRIIRDTAMSRQIKRLYEFRCQVCGLRLEIEPGEFYAEAHHLQPLGGEHQGPDVRENLLCLCPNHHALFDYFAMAFDPARLTMKHTLGKSFVDYHNNRATKDRIS